MPKKSNTSSVGVGCIALLLLLLLLLMFLLHGASRGGAGKPHQFMDACSKF